MAPTARIAVITLAVLACAGSAFAQRPDQRVAQSDQDTVGDGSLLDRPARLDVRDVVLEAALVELARKSGVPLAFSPGRLPSTARATCECEGASLREALDRLLVGTSLRYIEMVGQVVLFPPSDGRGRPGPRLLAPGHPSLATAALRRPPDVIRGSAVAVTRNGHSMASQARDSLGSIVGTITDAATGAPVANVQVTVGGVGRGFSDGRGSFRVAGVTAGRHTIGVTSIGYHRQSVAVEVLAGAVVTVDFELEIAPTSLAEIVVTATGSQRRVEIGHVLGRINADSLVREAPISSLSQLLTGRVAGVHVLQAQGTVGGQVSVQIRTPGSLLLSTDPIVVVDGVRYTSVTGPRSSVGSGVMNVEPSSPLNDINPNDIDSIEIVKGPAAATLYGTDAANGVIVITTKRGRPGPPRWNAYARATTTGIPSFDFPDTYWGWRTVDDVPSMSSPCHLRGVASGACSQDSVTVMTNPLNDSELAIFDTRPQSEYGVSVSGGQQDLRYYFSGDFERAVGPLRMPPALAAQLSQERGVARLPNEQLEPNALVRGNVRANLTAALSDRAEIRVNTGYANRMTRSLNISNPYVAGATRATPLNPYGSPTSTTIFGPEQVFSNTSTERIQRYFGSVTGELRARGWLSARAVVGLDVTSGKRESLVRRGEAERWFHPTGAVGDERSSQTVATGELSATGTVRWGRASFRTSAGGQYVWSLSDALLSFGTNLPPGGSSIGQAASVTSRRAYRETATLGTYIEESVGLNDRLYITGAVRLDGASTFGQNYSATLYPKASVSWLVSDEPILPRVPGVDELRLRYAFGASGQQPLPEWSRPTFTVQQGVYGGVASNVVGVNALGNPDIRPERVKEHEIGLDAAAAGRRLEVGLTWYWRRTVDQIQFQHLAPGLGSAFVNFGLTTGRGFEAQVSGSIIETRSLGWQVVAQHSSSRTVLRDLGDAGPRRDVMGGWVEGYPLGARFMRPLLGYEDANGDGIIAVGELLMGDTAVFAGVSTPPDVQTLTSTIGLAQHRIRLSALLERKSGFTQVNSLLHDQCQSGRCRAIVDPATPLDEQARAAAASSFAPPGAPLTAWTFVEKGDFTRLREVTAAVDLPSMVLTHLRLRSATLALSARNLALWTDFSGGDPESAFVSGIRGTSASGIPQARSYTIRIDLGF